MPSASPMSRLDDNPHPSKITRKAVKPGEVHRFFCVLPLDLMIFGEWFRGRYGHQLQLSLSVSSHKE